MGFGSGGAGGIGRGTGGSGGGGTSGVSGGSGSGVVPGGNTGSGSVGSSIRIELNISCQFLSSDGVTAAHLCVTRSR